MCLGSLPWSETQTTTTRKSTLKTTTIWRTISTTITEEREMIRGAEPSHRFPALETIRLVRPRPGRTEEDDCRAMDVVHGRETTITTTSSRGELSLKKLTRLTPSTPRLICWEIQLIMLSLAKGELGLLIPFSEIILCCIVMRDDLYSEHALHLAHVMTDKSRFDTLFRLNFKIFS